MGNVTILGPVDSSGTELPFFSSRVSAGFPGPALDHMEQKISLDDLLGINAPHTFLVRSLGDSMMGAGIFDADVMVVNRALQALHGDVVVAALNGEFFVKRLDISASQIVLRSDNPDFAPRFVMEGDELLIWGVVPDSIRNHRRHA